MNGIAIVMLGVMLSVFVTAAQLVGATGASQPRTSLLEQRLQEYRAGRFRPATHDLAGWPFDPDSVAFAQRAGRSNDGDPVTAAFLLEYAGAAYRTGQGSAYGSFERALKIAQRGPKGSTFDRAWHRAALALTEARGAGIDLGAVQATDHQRGTVDLHVYPGDPRSAEATVEALASRLTKAEVALATGVLREQVARWRGVLMIRTLEGATSGVSESQSGRPLPSSMDVSPRRTRELNIARERTLLGEAMRAFSQAEQDPDLRAEALLRRAATLAFIGEHQAVFHDGDHAEVVALFEEVARLTDQPRLAFLALLFAGRYLHTTGRLPQAEGHLAKAVSIDPHAWSARLALANVRYLTRGPTEDVLGGREHGRDHSDDPWVTYPYGSYARWPDLIQRLRAAVDAERPPDEARTYERR